MYPLINICLFQANNILFTKLFVIWLNAFSGGSQLSEFYLFIIYILSSLWSSYNGVNIMIIISSAYFGSTYLTLEKHE